MSSKKLKVVRVKHENSKDHRTMCSVQGCFTIFESPLEQESHMKEVHNPGFETLSLSRCFYCRKELKYKSVEEHEEVCLIKQKIEKFNRSQSQSLDGDIEYIELQEAKIKEESNPKKIRVHINARTRTALCIYCHSRVEHAKFMEHYKKCSRQPSKRREIRLNRYVNRQTTSCSEQSCNKIVQRFSLQRQLSVKNIERKRICPNCKKRMFSKELLIHMKSCDVPRGLLRFKCNYLNCDRMFATIPGRNVHMFTHNKYID